MNYCTRLYYRQIITRQDVNTAVIERFEVLLKIIFNPRSRKPLVCCLYVTAPISCIFQRIISPNDYRMLN
ncbi:hypothetical protein FEM33_17345 [Dyadobacter flavalbus]|uniref:Uncharacterized protein n=1 Tax=Dyadobacter flavalbus TaxID=2579942 RepID=A0A5M8QT53_9BACT|nr:hypothetical protein [Dyadobacter flavalbus]KAA6438451.1 hypothetical protein FEM33_17345 [Dyadobacter flavalbus]